MDVSKEMIERFLAGDCTAEEARLTAGYLKAHPEVQDMYLVKEEWNTAEDSGTPFPQNLTVEMWAQIRKETRPATVIYLKRLAIAASFIAVILLTYFLVYQSLAGSRQEVKKPAAVITKADQNPLVTIRNAEKAEKEIKLPDGSTVVLSLLSSFSYKMDSTLAARTIHLYGNAYFKVAKDASRPFTVFSGAVATTALGTEFYIGVDKTSGSIGVALYEGKVVIKTAGKVKDDDKTYYLLPGNKLLYDTIDHRVSIIAFRTDHNRTVSKSNDAGGRFAFNNESLAATLDQLSAIYGVAISYNKDQLKGIGFIGEIRRTDQLDNVLADIATLNNLIVIKEKNKYTIRPKK